MSLIIPDPRFEMPELFEPGRKPSGQVTVDNDRALFGQIIFASVPEYSMRDLIAGQLNASGGAFINSNRNFEFDGDGDKITYTRKFPVMSEFSILLRCKRHSIPVTNNAGLFSDKNVSNWGTTQGFSLNFRSTSSAFLFRVGTAETYKLEDTSIPVNTWMDVAATWRAGVSQDYYINGVRASYNANNIASSYTLSAITPRLGTYYDDASLRSLDGEIEYIYVFDKCLSASKINRVRRDPYQFLIPA